MLTTPQPLVLVAAVRPMSLGYAWCNGKGECGKDDQTVSDEALFIGESMDQLVESVEQDDSEVQLEIAEPEVRSDVLDGNASLFSC